MIGKKKSGFQITSVTSDYDGGSGEGLKEPTNGEAEPGGPFGPPLVNGGPGYGAGGQPPAPGPASARSPPPPSATEAAGGEGAARGAGAACEAGAASPLEPPAAQEAPAGAKSPLKAACPPGGSCSSRFRVVKLDHGLGEPYRRGRWTCVDLYDKDLDGHALAKVLEGAGRHVNSLDSQLEISSFCHKAVSQLWPKLHVPKSHSSPPQPCQGDAARAKPVAPGNTLNMLLQAARTLSSAGPAPAGADQPRHLYQHGPPAPASPPRLSAHAPAGRTQAGAAASVTAASKSDSGVPTATSREPLKPNPVQPHVAKGALVEQSASKQLSPNVSQPSSGEQGGIRKFSEPRSTSASPAPLGRDGSPSRKASSLRFVSPMQTLAKSMLSVGTHQDGEDDSGSSSSMVAIDNKIEQAMDLVKSHLMYAVREEVELLKEQIKDLIDRNSLLERENALLKSLANPDQLSQLQAQMRSAGSSGGSSSGSSPASTSTA